MKRFVLRSFGIENLCLEEVAVPRPGPGEVRVAWRSLSLNYRDLLVVRGQYNPRLPLPTTPLSDGAGVVTEVGEGVKQWSPGDRVLSHFVADWQDGPFCAEYLTTTLGTPGPGLAAEETVLPAHAVLALPSAMHDDTAATLPIAALTAWSALVTEAALQPGQSVLTLGTGGVSLFALQLAKAMGARVVITSKSAEKLARAKQLGADQGIDYSQHPDWDKEVRRSGEVDVVVENGGVGTLSRSLRAVKPGGVVALLGALTGLRGEVDISPVLMKRIQVRGVMVDSKRAFANLLQFLAEHPIEAVIDHRAPFADLPRQLEALGRGEHFGKIVLRLPS